MPSFAMGMPCGSCKYRSFVGTYRLHRQGGKNQRLSSNYKLMMEAIHSSETSVRTRATQHHNREDGILRSDRREILKSYKVTALFSSIFTKTLRLAGDVTAHKMCLFLILQFEIFCFPKFGETPEEMDAGFPEVFDRLASLSHLKTKRAS
jgi:hypothetical protein